MAITPLPTPAPSRSQSEAAFVAASNALFGALPGLVTEINTESAAIMVARTEADIAAQVATGAANYRGNYNAGTTYQIGQSVTSGGREFVAKTVNTGVTPVDGANWLLIVDRVSWQTIASTAAATGAVTFSNIPNTYAALRFEFQAVSGTATTFQVRVEYSANGSTYTSPVTLATATAASDVVRGSIIIPNYQANNIASIVALAFNQSVNTTVGAGAGDSRLVTRLDAPITHVRFSVNTGTFDAGAIVLQGM